MCIRDSCVLCVVDDAVAAGLGAAVGLHHEHAVFRHIQHHLRVEHGRGADGHPQLPQTVLAAAHHIVVERVHNDLSLIHISVAVCRAVKKLCGLELAVKWVNDLYYQGRKVCGILTEARCV